MVRFQSSYSEKGFKQNAKWFTCMEKAAKKLAIFTTSIISVIIGVAILVENAFYFTSMIGMLNVPTVLEVLTGASATRYILLLIGITLFVTGIIHVKKYWKDSKVVEYRKHIFLSIIMIIVLGGIAAYATTPEYDITENETLAAHSYNEMGFEMVQTMHQAEEDNTNIVMSPLSIGLAYSMLYEGSNTETQEELEEFLNIENHSTRQFQESNNKLIQNLENPEPEYTHHRRIGLAKDVETNLANGIWFREDITANEDYQQNMTQFYDAEITDTPMDQGTKDEINEFVEDNTEGRIDEIIDDLSHDTIAVLVNAVYFYGDWTESFDEDKTEEEEFTLKDGTTKQVPLMEKNEESKNFTAVNSDFETVEDPQEIQYQQEYDEGQTDQEIFLQAVRLPYGETERINMYVLHPEDIDEMTEEMGHEEFQKVRESLEEQTIDLKLPKFEAEYEADLESKTRALGLETPYEESEADFTDMLEGGAWVEEAIHKANIEVDEEGTEAAAATAVMMELSAPSHPQMIVDSPFMFIIFDEETESIMFQGVIEDPE